MTKEHVLALFRKMRSLEGEPRRQICGHIAQSFDYIVTAIANKCFIRVRQQVHLDDMISDGRMGLLDAIHRFDLSRGVAFNTFATPRVHGAIWDGIRERQWMPRLTLQRKNIFNQLARTLGKEDRQLTQEEVEAHFGIDKAQKVMEAVRGPNLVSTEDAFRSPDGDESSMPVPCVLQEEPDIDLPERVNILCRGFCSQKRQILVLYFYKEMTMKQIGEFMNTSESRISQVCTEMLKEIRSDPVKVELLRNQVAA